MGSWVARFTLLAGLCLFGTARAQVTEETVARKRFAFNPHPGDRCEYFLVTEFSASFSSARSPQDPVDRYVFTDSFGLMKNLGGRGAVGAAIEVSLAQGEVHYAPTARYKHWLGGMQSVEVTAGHFLSDSPGLIGPIVTARYSPVNYFHLQAGVCRYREQWTTVTYPYIYPNSFEFHDERNYRVFGGVGLAGVPGAISWGGQAVALVIAASIAISMY